MGNVLKANLGIDSAVIILQTGQVIFGPGEDVCVDACHNVHQRCQGQHNVGEEDNCQRQLQTQMPPVNKAIHSDTQTDACDKHGIVAMVIGVVTNYAKLQ